MYSVHVELILEKEISDCTVESRLMVTLLIWLACFYDLFFLSRAGKMQIHFLNRKPVYVACRRQTHSEIPTCIILYNFILFILNT